MSDPNYPPQYQQPGSYPPAPPGVPGASGAPQMQMSMAQPRTPITLIQQIAKVSMILAYVTMGAGALGAILFLTADGDGTLKMAQALQLIALGAGLGGTLWVLSAILRHRLMERGQF